MNLKKLFSKSIHPATRPAASPEPSSRVEETLDAAALDACVGGRTEGDGVGCYLRATTPRAT